MLVEPAASQSQDSGETAQPTQPTDQPPADQPPAGRLRRGLHSFSKLAGDWFRRQTKLPGSRKTPFSAANKPDVGNVADVVTSKVNETASPPDDAKPVKSFTEKSLPFLARWLGPAATELVTGVDPSQKAEPTGGASAESSPPLASAASRPEHSAPSVPGWTDPPIETTPGLTPEQQAIEKTTQERARSKWAEFRHKFVSTHGKFNESGTIKHAETSKRNWFKFFKEHTGGKSEHLGKAAEYLNKRLLHEVMADPEKLVMPKSETHDEDEHEGVSKRAAVRLLFSKRRPYDQFGKRNPAAAARKGRLLTAEQLNAIPSRGLRRVAHKLNAAHNLYQRLPRAQKVMARRRARQVVGGVAKSRLGGMLLRGGARVLASTAGRAVAGGALAAGGTAAIVTGGALLVAAFAALAAVITIKVIGAFQKFISNIVESNRSLAMYNGTIALAMARLDIARIRREIHRGHVLADSAKFAAEGLDRFEEAAEPYLTNWSMLWNNIAGGVGHAGGAVLETGTAIGGGIIGAWTGTQDWLSELMMSAMGMTEEEIEDARKHRELLEKIEENTRRENNMPLGTQTLRRLEQTNFQHSDAQGNVPGGPMPSLWEETL